MSVTSQHILDAAEGKLSAADYSSLVQQVRDGKLQDLLDVMARSGITITGDGVVIGNNNLNVVIKGELGRALSNAAARGLALFQFPPPVGDFVGRQKELTQIKSSLSAEAAVVGINGMGGIGKSELVFHAANSLKGKFSDGQLLVNMRGTDEVPRTPKDALAECVRSLLGAERRLPDDLEELEKLYGSSLTERTVLVFLDNAADSAQVSPLRPPTNCGLIITSRSPIVLPGITNITLGELAPPEARELLVQIATAINQSVADVICELCGHLPLAIRAAGSLLAVTPDLDAADLVNQLRDERTRLERLGKEGVDISVEASFNLSYARLSTDSASAFRKLAAFPSSFDSSAEEFVCGDVRHELLSDLVRRSLVMFDKNTRRYRLHELMRVFSKSLTNREEQLASAIQFAKHYLDVLRQSNQLYLKAGESHSKGLELFRREIENIRTGQALSSEYAEASDDAAQICWSYTSWGANVLLNNLPPDQLISWCEKSISIARRFNDRGGELGPVTLLGLVQLSKGEYKIAQEHFRQALGVAQETNDARGAATVYQHLGRALSDTGRLYEAIEAFEKAKKLWCDLGEHDNEGKIISDIGLAYSELRETNRAIQHLQLVLENARKGGNKLDEANALANLANVYSKRDKARAIQLSEQAAEIFAQLGYKQWSAQALASSGLWLVDLGDSTKGITRIEQSIASLHEIGDRHLEVCAVGQLGEAYMALNDSQNGIVAFERQLNLAREIGDLHREANALGDKAIMLVDIGEMDLAMIAFDEARRVAQLTGNLNHEFNTLCKSGEAYAKADKRDEAIKAFEDQVRIGRSTGVVSKELHALKHLADSFEKWGNIERAQEYMRTRITVSETSKDPHDYPDTVFECAEFLARRGDYEGAINHGRNAASVFERNGDPSCAGKVGHQIEEWERLYNVKSIAQA